MKILGIDVGDARVGLALSEGDGPAAPLRTVAAKGALTAIADLVREEGVDEIVIGLPLSLDGSEGPSAKKARRFAAELRRQVSCAIAFVDERFTTSAAHRELGASGVRHRDRRAVVDQVAATLLLQTHLDARAYAAQRTTETSWDAPEQEPTLAPPDRGPAPRGRKFAR